MALEAATSSIYLSTAPAPHCGVTAYNHRGRSALQATEQLMKIKCKCVPRLGRCKSSMHAEQRQQPHYSPATKQRQQQSFIPTTITTTKMTPKSTITNTSIAGNEIHTYSRIQGNKQALYHPRVSMTLVEDYRIITCGKLHVIS